MSVAGGRPLFGCPLRRHAGQDPKRSHSKCTARPVCRCASVVPLPFLARPQRNRARYWNHRWTERREGQLAIRWILRRGLSTLSNSCPPELLRDRRFPVASTELRFYTICKNCGPHRRQRGKRLGAYPKRDRYRFALGESFVLAIREACHGDWGSKVGKMVDGVDAVRSTARMADGIAGVTHSSGHDPKAVSTERPRPARNGAPQLMPFQHRMQACWA
jgi:hypothetical protein